MFVPANFYVNSDVYMPITHAIVFCLGTFGIVDYTNYDDMKYDVSI